MKRGFTLVELLVVIVVLSIIALIAIPTVAGVVYNAKKSQVEQSADGYLNAIEKQISINKMDNNDKNDIKDGTYRVPFDKVYKVNYKGQMPSNGWVKISSGKIESYSLEFDTYKISKKDGIKTISSVEIADK